MEIKTYTHIFFHASTKVVGGITFWVIHLSILHISFVTRFLKTGNVYSNETRVLGSDCKLTVSNTSQVYCNEFRCREGTSLAAYLKRLLKGHQICKLSIEMIKIVSV